MHVDEDDVASRVGEGGVRSGKEGRLVGRSGAATRVGDFRWRGEGGVGAGGRSDTVSAIGGDRGHQRRSAAIEGAEVRAREEERG